MQGLGDAHLTSLQLIGQEAALNGTYLQVLLPYYRRAPFLPKSAGAACDAGGKEHLWLCGRAGLPYVMMRYYQSVRSRFLGDTGMIQFFCFDFFISLPIVFFSFLRPRLRILLWITDHNSEVRNTAKVVPTHSSTEHLRGGSGISELI